MNASEELLKVAGNIKYIFNNTEITYHPQEVWIEGTHLLHLYYCFVIEDATVNRLSVRMNTDGAIHIDRACIQASVSGQGLVASSAWDGYVELEEEITPIRFRTTPSRVDAIGDELEVPTTTPYVFEEEEEIEPIRFRTTPSMVAPFTATLYMNRKIMRDYTWAEIREYTWQEIYDGFLW